MSPTTAALPTADAGSLPAAHDAPLQIAPFKGTPEEIERQWYDEVYRGRGDSMAQLTRRAVLMAHLRPSDRPPEFTAAFGLVRTEVARTNPQTQGPRRRAA